MSPDPLSRSVRLHFGLFAAAILATAVFKVNAAPPLIDIGFGRPGQPGDQIDRSPAEPCGIEVDFSSPLDRQQYGLDPDPSSSPRSGWASTTLINNGPVGNRVDLVFVGDGYTTSDLGSYATQINNVVTGFFAQEPFAAYAPYFNVHRVDVISNQSGVDEPDLGIFRDTALDMTFGSTPGNRFLSVNITKARNAATSAPDEDQILACANTTRYGGLAWFTLDIGTFPGGHALATEVALHEFGHSFGNVHDEYWTSGNTYSGGELSYANISIRYAATMQALQTKWFRWLELSNVDTFEGGMGSYQFGVHRPTNNSKMRSLSRPFEEVNVEQLVRLMYETVSPIDSATAASTEPYLAGTSFFVAPVQPNDHSLDVQWSIDGTPVPSATGTSFLPDYEALSDTVHTVSVTVVDNTSRVRDESIRATYMTATRSWTVHGGYPGAPSGLTATADSDSVFVDWNDNPEPDISLYKVYRAAAPGGPYGFVGSSVTSQFDDTSVTLGVTFYYVATAVAQGEESGFSNEDFGTPGVPPPAAPQNVVITTGEKQLMIDWNDNIEPNLAGYKLLRGLNPGGPYVQIHSGLLSSSAYLDTGLVNNTTYYYVVRARDTGGNESALSSEVAGTPVNLPPSAPTRLTAETRNRPVILQWNANPVRDINSYYVYFSDTPGGPYEEIDNDDTLSWLVTNLTNGLTYYFVIAAQDTAGLIGPYSAEVSATPVAGLAPQPPTGLVASPTNGGANLSWNPNAEPDLLEYVIYRGTSSGGPYVEQDRDDATAWGDGGLTNGVTYYYVVTAVNTGGNESGFSNEAAVTPIDNNPPANPTGLSGTPTDGGANLTWNANAEPDLREYVIYRGLASGGPYNEIDRKVGVGYSDTGLTNGVTYFYVVSAVDTSDNESGYSNEKAITPNFDPPPAAPQNLVAYPLNGGVFLDWDDNSEPDLDYYNTYFATASGGPYQEWDNDGPSEYTIHGLTNGTTYYFVVTAVDLAGHISAFSNEASATPVTDPPPLPPKNLTATAGPNRVTLDWFDNQDPDFDFFRVYRGSTAGGPYVQIAEPGVSAYVDNTVTGGQTYFYVVTAIDLAQQESAFSREASSTPIIPVPPPSNVNAVANVSSIRISWNAVNDPRVAGYGVYKSTASGGPYGSIASTQNTEHIDSNVVIGTTYFYVVTTIYDAQSESEYSVEASATMVDTTPPAAPTGLMATPGDGIVDLVWNANTEPDLDEYVVYRATAAGGPYSELARRSVVNYADTNVTNGVTYYYRVSAVDTNSNESALSTIATATPQGQPTGYRVQSGRVQVVGSTTDVTLTPVADMSRAFVLLSYGTGYTNGNTNANQVMVRGDLLDADTLRLYRGNSGNSSWVSWQVIECAGNEFTVYRGSGAFTNGQSVTSAAIGASVTPSNCLALVSADSNSNSRSYFNQAHLTARVDSATTVRVERAASGNSAVNYNWTVVAFDTSKIASFQRGTLSFSNPTDGAPATATISAVNPATSILLFQSRSTVNGEAYTSVAGRLASASSVQFYQYAGSSGTRTVEYAVIDFGSGCVAQRGQINNSGSTNWLTADAALTSVATSSTLHFVTLACDGTGTNYPRPYGTAAFTSPTNLRVERKRSGSRGYIEWQVLQLPAAN